jgi:hypothetical protein
MASYAVTKNVNLIANEDLRGHVYKLLKFEADAGIAKVVRAISPIQTSIGVLAENPNPDIDTTGMSVPVAILSGVVPMVAASAITAGNLIIAAAGGKVAGTTSIGTLAADTMAVGVALQDAQAGDIFDVLAMPMTSATET